MMENANDEVVSGTSDYATNAKNGHADKANDYDLVKVVLTWPKDVKVPGTLSLTGTGIAVDGSKPIGNATDSGTEVGAGVGPSHINFYDKDGNRLDAGDFVINPSSPDGSYMDSIVTTGSCVLYIEGDKNFGYEGSIANSGKSMGGAVMKFQFASTSGTATQRLLVYRGGFLQYNQAKNQPGSIATYELWDGKGRIDNTNGGLGKEFQKDTFDSGHRIGGPWNARSGKDKAGTLQPGVVGHDYNVTTAYNADGKKINPNGHIPPGWWLLGKYRDVGDTGNAALSDQWKNDGTDANPVWVLHQGAYVRWVQDTPAPGIYTKPYQYNPILPKDYNIGQPYGTSFKFDLTVIPPSSAYGRSGFQVHPDGRRDGTAGCIGIQEVNDCNRVLFLQNNYHGLKVKCVAY